MAYLLCEFYDDLVIDDVHEIAYHKHHTDMVLLQNVISHGYLKLYFPKNKSYVT